MKDKLKTAVISMWGAEVGAVTWTESDNAVFEFTKAFKNSLLNVSPITMPISANAKVDGRYAFAELDKVSFNGLPGLLSDSYPGQFASSVMDEFFARQGRAHEVINPVDLLCELGSRVMGALEYSSSDKVKKQSFDGAVSVEIDELVNFLKSITQDRGQMQLSLSDEDDKANETALFDILRVCTSVGGHQPKAFIALRDKDRANDNDRTEDAENTNGGYGQVLSGQSDIPDDYDYWLLKFDGLDDLKPNTLQTDCRIEYAYALMARAAGINISECRLLEENDRAHFITRRFDRRRNRGQSFKDENLNQDLSQSKITNGDTSAKLHMQSLCALAHYGYKQAGVYSYEQAFAIMRQMRLPKSSALELYRRMLFNVFARNQNDHTKNIAFLMDQKGRWKLAPAFNLTYSHDVASMKTCQHQMSINGKCDNFTREDLIAVGESISLPKPQRIIDEVKQVVSQWPDFAKRAGVKKKNIKYISQMHRMEI